MKKFIFLSFLFCLISGQYVNAQFYYYNDKYYESNVVLELGVSGGIMNALTDLGGKKGAGKPFVKDLRWATARSSFGIYAMAVYRNMIGVRLEGTFGEITGYDSILKEVSTSTFGRYDRNLSFKSKINEIQLAVEFHPFALINFEDGPFPFSPYTIVGAGRYSFDPQAELRGNWYSLQPLSTEGQGFKEYKERKPYELNQFNIIGGLGLKYDINSIFNARLEFVHRKLFTDYLDDVSTSYIDPNLFINYLPANMAAIAQQLANRKKELNPNDMTNAGDPRGNPKKNDAFFTIQLKVGITLGRQRR